MLTGESFFDEEETGLFLEGQGTPGCAQTFHDEGFSCPPQPFDVVPFSCPPQPFDVVETFVGQTCHEESVNPGCPIFWSCPMCSEIDASDVGFKSKC